MNRVEGNSVDALIERANRILANSRELKTTAQLFGSDSVVMYRVFSQNSYDIRVPSVGLNNRVVEVTFTPTDQSSNALGGVLRFEWELKVPPGTGVGTYVERLVPSDGISKWRLYLMGSDTAPIPTADYKFYFFTNGSGTFTASLV